MTLLLLLCECLEGGGGELGTGGFFYTEGGRGGGGGGSTGVGWLLVMSRLEQPVGGSWPVSLHLPYPE